MSIIRNEDETDHPGSGDKSANGKVLNVYFRENDEFILLTYFDH
jgi:hypothetical protein